MKVLIACEYSGVVREAFRKRGHNAWSCDLLDTEIPGQHFKCHMELIVVHEWDLIIMHLPCTKIALSGNATYGKGMPKHHERLDAIEWTKWMWDTAKRYSNRVAFENPMNVMGPVIGKRDQVIQPYEFGHPEMKETWLWLSGLPRLVPTNNVYDHMMTLPRKERHKNHWMGSGKGHERSRTYTGIADAMADQWG